MLNEKSRSEEGSERKNFLLILYRAGKMEEMKRRRQPFREGQGALTGNEEATSVHR